MISGRVAGSEDGTILTFSGEPVTGSCTVATDCSGTATITPKRRSEMRFSLAVVDGGKEMLAIETDADTRIEPIRMVRRQAPTVCPTSETVGDKSRLHSLTPKKAKKRRKLV